MPLVPKSMRRSGSDSAFGAYLREQRRSVAHHKRAAGRGADIHGDMREKAADRGAEARPRATRAVSSIPRSSMAPSASTAKTSTPSATACRWRSRRGMRSEHFRTELITNVSHDIKTPLTSIINYVDLLRARRSQKTRRCANISTFCAAVGAAEEADRRSARGVQGVDGQP